MPKIPLEDQLASWVMLWEQLYPALARLVAASGDQGAGAELRQFAADLQHIAQLPQRLHPEQSSVPLPTSAPDLFRSSSGGMVQPTTRQAAILLVDDEPDIVFVLSRLVAALTTGYQVVTARDGPDALAKLALYSVPLVIADYNLPGMDGLQLTQVIKQASPDTKVVIVSAYASLTLERRVREQGVDYYMSKPYQLNELECILLEVLAKSPLA